MLSAGRASSFQARGYLWSGLGGRIVYGLVLWAQTPGTLAAIAVLHQHHLRAVIGALFFGERFGRNRAVAAAVVVAGIVMINLA